MPLAPTIGYGTAPVAPAPTAFADMQPRINKLIDRWSDIELRAKDARTIRKARVNVEKLRGSNKLGDGEVYIAVRVIDENITRELPARLQYLKSGNRLATFEPADATVMDENTAIQTLEGEFWRVMTYDNWEMDYIKAFDGSELLGWDWVEVVFDTSKPGHVRIDHVGNDMLIIDKRAQNVQDSSIVIRPYNVSDVALKRMAKENAFDPEQVKEILEKFSDNDDAADCRIFHVYYKDDDGLVWHCWYNKDGEKFLVEPKELYIGVDVYKMTTTETMDPAPQVAETWEPVHENTYPFIPLFHRSTEERTITSISGRIEDDYFMQETLSELLSGLVNKSKDAAKTMWVPEATNPELSTGAPKQTTAVVKNGAIWDAGLKPISVPFPESSLFQVINTLFTRNSEANAQISAATNNRVDSRKTATEVAQASRTNAELSGAQVLFFSMFLRNVFQSAWRIIQSQAQQGLIKFMPGPEGKNDMALIAKDFVIKPAGDTDYVMRANKIAAMQQDYPMIANTPLVGIFSQDYMRLRYPDRAPAYMQVMNSAEIQKAQQAKQLLGTVAGLLQHAVTDEHGQLRPEWQAQESQLAQIANQVKGTINAPIIPPAQQSQ